MNKKATSTTKSTVKVIGVGCGGNNIVNHISQSHLEGFSFVACDMDAKVLEKSTATTTLQLGTDGLGSGNSPEKARIAAEENLDAIKWALRPLSLPLCHSSWKVNADSHKHRKEFKTWQETRMLSFFSTTSTSKNNTATCP